RDGRDREEGITHVVLFHCDPDGRRLLRGRRSPGRRVFHAAPAAPRLPEGAMKLRTSDTQHHQLWKLVTDAHEGTDKVRVDKAALKALLQDHIALNQEVLRKHGALPETTN